MTNRVSTPGAQTTEDEQVRRCISGDCNCSERFASKHNPEPAPEKCLTIRTCKCGRDGLQKLIARWEGYYDAFTKPFYTVTGKPDAMKGLRQCIEELQQVMAEARSLPQTREMPTIDALCKIHSIAVQMWCDGKNDSATMVSRMEEIVSLSAAVISTTKLEDSSPSPQPAQLGCIHSVPTPGCAACEPTVQRLKREASPQPAKETK